MTAAAHDRLAGRIPMVTARHLCAVAAERGLGITDVLAGTSVVAADLDQRDADLRADDEITMVRNVIRLLPDASGLGVAVGRRISVTSLGMFGLAAMSSATPRELIAVWLRYFALSALRVALQVEEGPTEAVVTLDSTALPRDVRRFFADRDLAAIVSTVSVIALPVLSRYADRVQIRLAASDEHLRALMSELPLTDVGFDGESTVIRVPKEMLDEPLPQADRHTLEMSTARCDEMLERLHRGDGLAAVVQSMLVGRSGPLPSAPVVARALQMHPRALRRRLAEEGVCFRDLSNHAKAVMAAELLEESDMTVEQIARRLGYAETAAFNHAFTRWYGCAPSRYRATSPQA